MPQDQQDQTSKITTKNIWTGVVIVVAVLLLVWWYVALRIAPAPKSNALSPEVLKSLTATGTSTKPLSKTVLKSLTATGTSAKPLSPEVLQNLTAPN